MATRRPSRVELDGRRLHQRLRCTRSAVRSDEPTRNGRRIERSRVEGAPPVPSRSSLPAPPVPSCGSGLLVELAGVEGDGVGAEGDVDDSGVASEGLGGASLAVSTSSLDVLPQPKLTAPSPIANQIRCRRRCTESISTLVPNDTTREQPKRRAGPTQGTGTSCTTSPAVIPRWASAPASSATCSPSTWPWVLTARRNGASGVM